MISDDDSSPTLKRKRSEITSDLDISPELFNSDRCDTTSLPSKIFNDPIHGSIELNGLLVKLIDTPQFQRLRRLKQLGASYYVFPGASHQRFEHSIGTCHLAGELLNHLRQHQPSLKITEEDVLCVQIAALCHDLGHGPFSHLFEQMVAEVLPAKQWKHEKASIEMFDHMIEKNNLMPYFQQAGLDETDIICIKELIYGELNTDSEASADILQTIWPYKGRTIDKSFLYEIVSNKLTGIDVDKFDYMARDSYHLGTKISFEHTRFMKFYRVIKVADGKRHLCLRDKEVKSCYELFRIRDDLHRRAYQHPVVKSIEMMIQEVLLAANQHLLFNTADGRRVSLAECIDDMFAFSQIDDHVITLIKYSSLPEMNPAKEIIRKLENREIYRYIGNTHVRFTENFDKNVGRAVCEEIIGFCRNVNEANGLTSADLIVQVVELNCGDRGEDPIRNMWFYTKNNRDQAMRISKEQVSTLLPQNFREHDIRLYCKTREPITDSVVRCAFKEYCQKKGYATPKGSDDWNNESLGYLIHERSLRIDQSSTGHRSMSM